TDDGAVDEAIKRAERFDPELRYRPLGRASAVLVALLLFALSFFHYYTAGFGLLREVTHRGVHMAFVLALIFLVFPAWGGRSGPTPPLSTLMRPGGIPLIDWAFALAAAAAALYVPWVFADLAFRVGNPLQIDVVMGSVMIV